MTVTWAHGERVLSDRVKTDYVQHAFKNQIAGVRSLCGRGSFPQDATPPTTTVTVCQVCATKAKPPDSPTKGGQYEQGHAWAQYKHSLRSPVHRSPKGYES